MTSIQNYLYDIDKIIRYSINLPFKKDEIRELLVEAIDYAKFLTKICNPRDYSNIISFINTWESCLNLYFGIRHPGIIDRPLSSHELSYHEKNLKSYWFSILSEKGIKKIHQVRHRKKFKVVVSAFQDTILPLVFNNIFFEYLKIPIKFEIKPWYRHIKELEINPEVIASIHNFIPIHQRMIISLSQRKVPKLRFYKPLFACGGHTVYISKKHVIKRGISTDSINKYFKDPNFVFKERERKKILNEITSTVEPDTDHEYVLRAILRENYIENFDIKYRDSSTGLKLFLDGKVDLYCGGLSYEYPLLANFLKGMAIPLLRPHEIQYIQKQKRMIPNIDGLITFNEHIEKNENLLEDVAYGWFIMIVLLKELKKRYYEGDTLSTHSLEHILRVLYYQGGISFLDLDALLNLYNFDIDDIYSGNYDRFYSSFENMPIDEEDLIKYWTNVQNILSRKNFSQFQKSNELTSFSGLNVNRSDFEYGQAEIMKISLDEFIHPLAIPKKRQKAYNKK